MNIDEVILKGMVKEIKPFIFAVVVENQYDRAMLFCRYQEYYESPFPEIRGNVFTIEEYMKIYTHNNNKKYFSYPDDWAGYNIPSATLIEASKRFKDTSGPYDNIMSRIIEYCESESMKRNNNEPHLWYLMGVDDLLNSRIMNHEIAHGLYYTNNEYKSNMDNLIENMLLRDQLLLEEDLIKIGYSNDTNILRDEIQAYMATGMLKSWDREIYEKYSPEYIKVFNEYVKSTTEL